MEDTLFQYVVKSGRPHKEVRTEIMNEFGIKQQRFTNWMARGTPIFIRHGRGFAINAVGVGETNWIERVE